MDFGFTRIIEMFEERFGKEATTAIVLIAVLALVCVCTKTIFDDFVIPCYRLTIMLVDTGAFIAIKNWANSVTKNQMIAAGIELTVLMCCTSIYYNRVKYFAIKSIRKTIMDDPQKFLKMLDDSIQAEVKKLINPLAEPPATQEPPQPQSET